MSDTDTSLECPVMQGLCIECNARPIQEGRNCLCKECSALLKPTMSTRSYPTELRTIAAQIQRWLDWDKFERACGGYATDPDTAIMRLPVSYWPTHGALENWVKALREAANRLESSEHHQE